MMAAVNSNSLSFCHHRSTFKVAADVVCCCLKTISHSTYFTLSQNYPEILDCRQHLLAVSIKVPCPDSIQSALSTFHVASLSDYDHLRGFQYLNTNYHSKSTFWAYSWLITSHHLKSWLATAIGVSDAWILSSVNIWFWQCSCVVVWRQETSKRYMCVITLIYYYPTPAFL